MEITIRKVIAMGLFKEKIKITKRTDMPNFKEKIKMYEEWLTERKISDAILNLLQREVIPAGAHPMFESILLDKDGNNKNIVDYDGLTDDQQAFVDYLLWNSYDFIAHVNEATLVKEAEENKVFAGACIDAMAWRICSVEQIASMSYNTKMTLYKLYA